jgi:hypothetical protein
LKKIYDLLLLWIWFEHALSNHTQNLFDGELAAKKKEVKKESGLGLAFKKEENFGDWYSDVRRYLNPSLSEMMKV